MHEWKTAAQLEAAEKVAIDAGRRMIAVAIEMLGDAAGDDRDLGNLLLSIALGVALNIASEIDEKIPRLAAKAFLKALEDNP
jgi:hypothetical protein